MGKKIATVSGTTGVGLFIASLVLPKMVEGTPMLVQAGLLGLSVALIGTPIAWLLFSKTGAHQGAGTTIHIENNYSPLSDLAGASTTADPEPKLDRIFPPTVTQTDPQPPGGQLADDTLEATGVLFPLGLYVGMVIVSAGKLMDELNSLEIAIRAYNGTGKAIRVAFVDGVIMGAEANQAGVALPSAVWKVEHTPQPIEPNKEFMVVLEQRVSPATAETYRNAMEGDYVTLDLRSLNIQIEIADNPANRSRLPLWDGATIRRRDDVFTGRMIMATGSTSTSPKASLG